MQLSVELYLKDLLIRRTSRCPKHVVPLLPVCAASNTGEAEWRRVYCANSAAHQEQELMMTIAMSCVVSVATTPA